MKLVWNLLNRALREVRIIWKEGGKFPSVNHKQLYSLYHQIRKGIWKNLGVNNWDEFKQLLLNGKNQKTLI